MVQKNVGPKLWHPKNWLALGFVHEAPVNLTTGPICNSWSLAWDFGWSNLDQPKPTGPNGTSWSFGWSFG